MINRHFNLILERHELHYLPKSFALIGKKNICNNIGERAEITAAFRTSKFCYVQSPF